METKFYNVFGISLFSRKQIFFSEGLLLIISDEHRNGNSKSDLAGSSQCFLCFHGFLFC